MSSGGPHPAHHEPQEAPRPAPSRIVGIGASAGGVEAFSGLLKALPPNTGMAFVVLSHLSPTHRSELSRILAPLTRMPVRDAVDGEAVQSDHVYVLTPNRILTIAEGRLHLASRDGGVQRPTGIDRFLQSLAVDLGPRAVGVILSGTGSDGTAGLQAIKARGGTTFAEDPLLAAFEGMPRSAASSGAVDFVLPLAEIARSLAELAASAGASPESEATAPTVGAPPVLDDGTSPPMPDYSEAEGEALEAIIRILQEATGVDFHHYKRPSLARRVRHRVDELGLVDFAAYLPRLRQDPGEVAALLDTVLIQVTKFFREPATFAALQKSVIPSLLSGRTSARPLRAWVVGCATGQEAYSLAIAFLETEASLGLEGLVRVFASDLSDSGLAKARLGQYSREETDGLSPERLQRFFTPVDHGFQVSKRLRDICVFARHDITRDPPFAQLDLVLCSNVLIYFDQILQQRVLQNAHYALKPTGYLALGPAETTIGAEGLFTALDRKQKIYLRRHAPSRPHVSPARTGDPRLGAGRPASPAVPPLQWSTAELQRAAEQVFFAEFPAASVIVNPELEVLHFQGPTAPYLEAPTGGPTMQLLRLAHPDLRLPLGRMLRRAKRDRAAVRQRGIPMKAEGKARTVSLSVLPVSLDDAEAQHFLVVFDRSEGRDAPGGGRAQGAAAGAGAGSEADARVPELETELAENKEYFEAIVDQQDATHAELQAAYEASLSINEEYQSTNEELESAKEEMQSLNEEMVTTNEQLHQRHAELQARTAEVSSLLESVDMPMLLLTRNLRLRAFNSRAAGELHLSQALVGRGLPGAHVPVSLLELQDLVDGALRDNDVQEREIQDARGTWLALRVWPVHPGSEGGTVAVALLDISKLKSDVAEAAAGRAYSEAVVEAVMQPLVALDDEHRMLHANSAFHLTFQTAAAAIAGQRIAELGDGEWGGPELEAFLQRARQANQSPRGPEITVDSKRLGRRTFQLSAGPIAQPGQSEARLLVAIEDITVRKLAEAAAMEASRMQAVSALAGGVAHEINNQMTTVLGFADYLFKQATLTDSERDDVKRIVKAARRSADVTQQLLAFSRRQALQMVVVDLNALIAVSEAILSRAVGPGIALEISLGENVGQVRADQAQLEQVVVNLCLNARDAMNGAGRLTIATTTVLATDPVSSRRGGATAPRGSYARLIVSDTGAGMDEVTQARIFEPFFTTKAFGAGTGLGLASVLGTVEQCGGLIWVESQPGRGTTFTIDLPRLETEAEPMPVAVSDPAKGGTETLLVVEDEEGVRTWLARTLRELGYTVVEASDGVEALRLVVEARRPFDLVLSDIVIPGLDGAQLRTRLAEVHPGLPVLLVSGFALEELVRQGRLDSETVLLRKPFDPATVASEVRKALDAAP